jgi:hypothetical protein
VHFFCPSVSFLAEAQPRLKTGENKGHFLTKVHIKFFRRPHNYKARNIIGRITNLFCIYLFQIDTFINIYILTIFFFSICNIISYLFT